VIPSITGKLVLGSTTDVESLKDPEYHWYNGLTFGIGKFATLSSFAIQDHTIHYWISKA